MSVARRGQIASRRRQFQIACLRVTFKGIRTACQTCHSTPRDHRSFSPQHESGLCVFQVQTHQGLRNVSGTDTPRLTQYFRYRHTTAYAIFQVQTHHGLHNISGTDTPRLTQYFRYRHTTAYAIFPFRMDGAIRILPKSELSVHLVNYARMYKGIQMKSKLKHTALTFVNFQLDAQNSLFIYLYTIHLLKSSTCFEQYAAHLQEF